MRCMFKGLALLCMLCFIIPNSFSIASPIFSDNSLIINTITNETVIHEYDLDNDPSFISTRTITNNNEYGVWIYTIYNGHSDEVRLDIDLSTFKLMLDGGGWKYYTIDLESSADTTIGLRFVRTKIFLMDEEMFVDVIQTHFSMETSCDTEKDYSIFLEVRFPFSLLKSKSRSFDISDFNTYQIFLTYFERPFFNSLPRLFQQVFTYLQSLFDKDDLDDNVVNACSTSNAYFSMRLGFSSPDDDRGPQRMETRFFFGRNSIFDPQVFRFNVIPYDIEREYSLIYNASFLTVDDASTEAFYRSFSVCFEPIAELQITSIPGKGKISYDFGSSGGKATRISFSAVGGSLSNIIQRFLIDPLPSYMSFDLTVLGERSFVYESDRSYDVTYMMDDVQEGNIVALALTDLPEKMTVSWGLRVHLLSLTASGLIDLDMSSDITFASLSLFGSEDPFMEISNFPRKLRLDASVDARHLNGYVQASKYSGAITTITVPIRFNKWEITSVLELYDGYGLASFDLPSDDDPHVLVGLDTGGTRLFGLMLTVVDTEASKQVFSITVEAIATDDLSISFDYTDGAVSNLVWSGRITEIVDLVISLYFEGADFIIGATWSIGEKGLLELQLNKPIEVTFADIENTEFKLSGFVSLNENSYIKIEWEWGPTGYFMIYTREPIGDMLHFELGYGPVKNSFHQYGFNITGTDFLDVKRTVMWDTENGIIPRIWILGDNPFPGEWDVWLLWNHQWYEVR
jgi:hypothetical protein